jgi:hypothetical protein
VPGCLDWVKAAVVGVEEAIKTDQTYVVKIDDWFGKRWLGFSGKALGALGVLGRWRSISPKARLAVDGPRARHFSWRNQSTQT